jgi:hypothetical protein
MDDEQHRPTNRWLPQFSLLSALLLMTVVGMSIVILQLWREVGPLRDEVCWLRDEVGELSIDDETKLHAIEVRTNDDFLWKWRVWVPEGQSVVVRSQWGNVPRSGVPAGNSQIALHRGEQWITFSARPSHGQKGWTAQLATEMGSSGTSIQDHEHWWDWPKNAFTGEGVGNTTEMAKEGQTNFVLKRLRVAPIDSSSELFKMDEPTAGFIIWLERQ